jgi:hypothetical protein
VTELYGSGYYMGHTAFIHFLCLANFTFISVRVSKGSQDSKVSILTGYGLDDQGVGVKPWKRQEFSLHVI